MCPSPVNPVAGRALSKPRLRFKKTGEYQGPDQVTAPGFEGMAALKALAKRVKLGGETEA